MSAASSPSSSTPSPPSSLPGRLPRGRRRSATSNTNPAQATPARLPRRLALGVFSSDALSSTAYATEEILRVLMLYTVTTGLGDNGIPVPALRLSWPIALAIALLIIIITLSYRQTIRAYPGGANAYLVTRDNLGVIPSLIAAASLILDHVFTVAVAVSAGIAAIASALPPLRGYVVPLCLALIAVITYLNARRVKESGSLLALPTYVFLGSMLLMIVIGCIQVWTGNLPAALPGVMTAEQAAEAMAQSIGSDETALGTITLFALLRAFASGCAVLTGIEAVPDHAPSFQRPEAKNAASTMAIMAVVLVVLFLGLTFLANAFRVAALPEGVRGYETVLSQVARRVFSGDLLTAGYYLLTASTAAILFVAAYLAYQDFPRIASLLARDTFLPRQFVTLGDREVFRSGIVVLSVAAAVLVLLFGGSVRALLPLYVIGVFISFTLSQGAMVRKWLTERGPGWRFGLSMNALGATVTGVVLTVIAVTRINSGHPTGLSVAGTDIQYGSWLIFALVPLLVMMFLKIRGHYEEIACYLVPDSLPSLMRERVRGHVHHTVLVLVPAIHKGIFPALEYARSLSDDARAVYIEMDPSNTPALKEDWERHIRGVPLIIIESPHRSLIDPLMEYIEQVKDERDDDVVTVVLPELVSVQKWWHRFLHNSSGNAVRDALALRRDVVVTNYPYFP